MTGDHRVNDRFLVTYVPLPRLWCAVCDKTTLLRSLDTASVVVVQAQHRCGPRTSPWESAGLAR